MHWIVKLCKAESVTVLTALILITPVCGALFACGCTWPGLGLEANCNYFDPQAPYHCPWCASSFAGSISVSVSILASYVSTKQYIHLGNGTISNSRKVIAILVGLIGFLLLAFMTAWLSASLQHYPHFIVPLHEGM